MKRTKRTFYESPLKHIQLSSKRWKQRQAQKRLAHEAKQGTKSKQNFVSPLNSTSGQDSVIILSDNESDLNEQEQPSKNKKNLKKAKRDSHVLSAQDTQTSECLHNSNQSLNQRDIELTPRQHKKRKKGSALLNNNNSLLSTSCLLISDTEDSEIATVDTDDENIAPISDRVSQGADDIVVVWSSTKPTSNSDSQTNKTKATYEEYERLFMVDRTPNLNNCNLVEPSQETVPLTTSRKKRKYNEKEENNLLFNKKGLQFPKARDISYTISVEKPRSIIKSLNRLKQHAINSNSTSTRTTATTTSASDNSVPTTTSATNSSGTLSTPANGLREIVIDGNNIALAHTNGKKFSEEGLKIVIDYFKRRGHSVKAFVPQYRRAQYHPLLEKLHAEGNVVFTPSRNIAGKWITPYDDRFILQYATVCKGIVVSMDQYRDLYNEKPEWRDTIENRLLAPTFVGNYVMFPEDPLGRKGPSLDVFLRH